MTKRILVSLMAIGACSLAHADGSDWRVYSALGVSNGGDTIASGSIVDTSNNRTVPFQIKAGTGVGFRVGADYRITDLLSVQGSAGYSSESPMGSNASLTFTTNPIELMGFVNFTDSLRIGGGLRKTFADMTGSGLTDGWQGLGRYTSTRGSVVEAQYLFASSTGSRDNMFGISVLYINESFTHDSVSFNGNHYELAGTYYY